MVFKCYEICISSSLLKVDIEFVCNKIGFSKWAFILHDKDSICPHYHIYLDCGSDMIDSKFIASWFKVPLNCVSKASCDVDIVRSYLLHSGQNVNGLYQYHPSELVSNF